MTNRQTLSSHEYKNRYLYIVIRQAPEKEPNTYLYCCGINTTRFDSICWGKAGICSNPAFKGLQQMRSHTAALVLKKGLSPKPAHGTDCSPITPSGDGWHRESMFIHHASPADIKDILQFSVLDLVRLVLSVCAPDAKIPAKMPTPPKLQAWLDTFNVKNYVEAAPPPITRLLDRK
jgi:hypothetical protein